MGWSPPWGCRGLGEQLRTLRAVCTVCRDGLPPGAVLGGSPCPYLLFEWPLDLVPSREAESVAVAGAMRKCGCQAVRE